MGPTIYPNSVCPPFPAVSRFGLPIRPAALAAVGSRGRAEEGGTVAGGRKKAEAHGVATGPNAGVSIISSCLILIGPKRHAPAKARLAHLEAHNINFDFLFNLLFANSM
jgi:hypothetical protein